eukprot:gene22544-9022_t
MPRVRFWKPLKSKFGDYLLMGSIVGAIAMCNLQLNKRI